MIFSLILSFFMFSFDGFTSNYLSFNIFNYSFFTTNYSIIALSIIYPLFNNDKKYIITSTIMGLLFDIVYTNTFIFNAVIFFLIAIFIKFIYNYLSENILGYILVSLLAVVLYYILTFSLLTTLGHINFEIIILLKKLVSILPMTIIVSLILALLIKLLERKKILKQVK